MPAVEQALSITGLTKRFGATLALDEAALTVRAGTVHALLGGNGSGKSTTVKVLAGVHHADAGRLRIGAVDHDLSRFGPSEARVAGLRFVHQDLGLFDGLSVAENIAFGTDFPTTGGRVRWGSLRRWVEALLHDHELDIDPSTPINALRPADRTMVAIARALAGDRPVTPGTSGTDTCTDTAAGPGPVLVLDEPTASLGQHESALLLRRIQRHAKRGQTVLMVSHRMAEVLSVADDFTVFRDGRTVETLVDASPTEDELVALMAGRAVDSLRPSHPATSDRSHHLVGAAPRLQVTGLAGGPLRGVDLTAYRGEVVGVAGLVGSGRSTLLRLLFGCDRPTAGAVALDGEAHRPAQVAAAMAAGVALVPEDRGRDAAFADLAVVDNLSMTSLGSYWTPLGMDRGRERSTARRLIGEFAVRTSGPDAPFSSMSGGNQQKVVLARWLQREPRLLLLDEPTQGVDVMSRVDIYRLVREVAARGTTVLVASSDASELLALCDRIVVLREGRVDEELSTIGLESDVLTMKLLRSRSVEQEAS